MTKQPIGIEYTFRLHWIPSCDIAEPYGRIDIFDIVELAGSYGLVWRG